MTTYLRDADDALDDIRAAYRLDILSGRSHRSSGLIEWTMRRLRMAGVSATLESVVHDALNDVRRSRQTCTTQGTPS